MKGKLMFDKKITCCYLYPITKYGYPPDASYTLKYIDEMYNLGFTSIELEGIREEHLNKVYELRNVIENKLKDKSIELPYFCAVLPGLSSLDEKVRKHNLQLLERGCEIAKLFRSMGILDNTPLPPYQFPEDIPIVRHYDEDSLNRAFFPQDFSWNKYEDILVDTFRTVCDIAAKYDLTYQMHPAVGVLFSTPDGFLRFFDKVKRDNLRFNFDTANLFAMRENLSLSLLRLHEHIDYIHISDNRGEKVEHLPIGKGKIDWNKFFETIDKIGFIGNFGIDIGGQESGVRKLNFSYIDAAKYLEQKWLKKN